MGFTTLIFLTGGSARADTASLVLLRPMVVLALGYAIYQWLGSERTGFAVPVGALLALAGFALVQLIPLPPMIWTSLPGREPLAEAQDAAQIALTWQPVSVVPMATINSFGAVLVPLAGLILLAISPEKVRSNTLKLVTGLMLISAALGLLQALAPSQAILYFYRITNEGFPVGLFANRNHHAVMLAATIPFVLAYGEKFARDRAGPFDWIGRGLGLGLVALAVMTGSRIGTLLAMGAFLVTVTIFANARLSSTSRPANRSKRIAVTLIPLGLILTATLLFLTGVGAGFERLADKDSFDDLRFQILPEISAMLGQALPFGWGLGTFPEVFEVYERNELIQPAYINHAHNDWLEIIIEGGLVIPLILAVIARWIARIAWANRKQIAHPIAAASQMRFCALLAILVLVAGSLFDYPLRTPAAALAFVVFLVTFTAPPSAAEGRGRR
ncbi:O-antigen ligase family protein [Qipengyuania sp. ASV99]|uniref:O-antigen ligase family protein n=1 Tax=Qipengyuania sp. ASV99 TaxID=3399681 RepID=UPI003A4C79E1